MSRALRWTPGAIALLATTVALTPVLSAAAPASGAARPPGVLGGADVIISVAPGGPSGLDSWKIYDKSGDAIRAGDASGLGPGDVIDGFSQPKTEEEFLLCFSVDPSSLGGSSPEIDFPFPGINFNVADQAGKMQAAGDAFLTTEGYDRDGTPIGLGLFNNVLAINQSLPYADSFPLMPVVTPALPVGAAPLDDVNGGGGPATKLFYTFAAGSPKLGGGSGADVWFDPTAVLDVDCDEVGCDGDGGDESIFASAADLGLLTGDEMNAVSVFDDGNRVFDGDDQLLFSLAPGSPSLPVLGATASDVLSVRFGEAPEIFAPFADLGLGGGDVIDMLELVPLVGDPLTTIEQKLNDFVPRVLSILGLCPGDIEIAILGGEPDGLVGALLAVQPGNDPLSGGPCAGALTGLQQPSLAAVVQLDDNGQIVLARPVPPNACGRFVQIVHPETCFVSNVAQIP